MKEKGDWTFRTATVLPVKLVRPDLPAQQVAPVDRETIRAYEGGGVCRLHLKTNIREDRTNVGPGQRVGAASPRGQFD
eukprot:12172690-Prorocentrum_lima.AAC.1